VLSTVSTFGHVDPVEDAELSSDGPVFKVGVLFNVFIETHSVVQDAQKLDLHPSVFWLQFPVRCNWLLHWSTICRHP